MHQSRIAVLVLCFLAWAAARVPAQELVVKRDANVRQEPTTASNAIGRVLAGDTVALVDAAREHGYVHVRTLGMDTEGWVYGRLVGPLAGAPESAPTGLGSTAGVMTAPASYHGCSLEGDPSAAGRNYPAISELNELKNRYHAPQARDIDSSVTLARLVTPGADESRFDEHKGAVVEGVVDAVKVGGIETVNCKARSAAYRDTHIEISLRAHDAETERVIVEVTPRWRSAMAAHGVDWSTGALRTHLIGRVVRFRGWLLFDAEHQNEAENTSPGNPKDWRATVWEIHPVTSFEVIDSSR